MTRYLGIDYGSKKIGIAISSEDNIFAFPFIIIQNNNKSEASNKIIDILKEKDIKNILVGESLNLNGIENKIFKETKEFIETLKTLFKEKENIDLNVYFEKEWLSTVEARRYDDRRDADDSAAAIILQRYLDKVNNKKII